jgi:protein SCO1/2
MFKLSHPRLIPALTLLIVALGAAAVLLSVNRSVPDSSAAPVLPIGTRFDLTTPDGRRVTDESYRGKWLLVYFGYTSCPDVCPTTMNEIAGALNGLGPLADRVQPLFITLDPERDTASVMAQYPKAFDARISGLLGTLQQTAAAAEEYHAYYAVQDLGNDEYVIDRSSFIYVVNPMGGLAKLLTGDLPGHQMADELRQLMR